MIKRIAKPEEETNSRSPGTSGAPGARPPTTAVEDLYALENHYTANAAQKRGGRVVHLPVDEYADQLAEDPKDQDFFMSQWVETIHAEVARRLREEWERAGKGHEFGEYEPFLLEKKGNES